MSPDRPSNSKYNTESQLQLVLSGVADQNVELLFLSTDKITVNSSIMKGQLFVAFVAFLALGSGVLAIGSKECTYGPSYWCKNLTTAASCQAVTHCIQTVWVYQQLPADPSSVCQTCLDMVKQARDQLLSNETQEEIKEVFEGSCALLHVKPIVKECDKIADEYIPELIDTLASEMDPQVVCSVAGLCNNERFLKLIEEEEAKSKVDSCEGCQTVIGIMEDKFDKMSRDQVLQNFLEICGKFGSLADGCSNIIVTYFTEIYNHLKQNFNPNQVCLMAGECSAQFHSHANVEITPMSNIGFVPIDRKQGEDLPCELCEQLVTHLKDILIANTTESEFKLVLEGLCNQTSSFRAQCLSLVDEYYGILYDFLVTELDSNAVCQLAGICPSNDTLQAPIIPLLPVQSAQKALEITQKPVTRINMGQEGSDVKVMSSPENAQLPIERLTPPHIQELYNSETCVFCEYFLHYLQQVITNPKSEKEIKRIIDGACARLPSSINQTCAQFVDMYEPALIAILAQEIDPSQVCPLIKACPSSDVKDVEVFMKQPSDGEKCPLCLFAVQKLEEMVTNNKTEASIKSALGKLCGVLPKNLAGECNDFVAQYSKTLVELLVADLTPQEVCVFLELCDDKNPPRNLVGGDISTNIIMDSTVNGAAKALPSNNNGQCVLCEFVIKQVQDELKDNKTEENIKRTVRNICNFLPKSIGKECNDFVSQYGDTIIQALIEATNPTELCSYLGLCGNQLLLAKVAIFECTVCESVVYAAEKILANPKVDHSIDHVLKKACRALPKNERSKCLEIIDSYGKTIYDLIIHLADKGLVCREIGLCGAVVARPVRELLIGSNKCTRGPSYWCASNENAESCGEGAKKHCQDKVWLAGARPN